MTSRNPATSPRAAAGDSVADPPPPINQRRRRLSATTKSTRPSKFAPGWATRRSCRREGRYLRCVPALGCGLSRGSRHHPYRTARDRQRIFGAPVWAQSKSSDRTAHARAGKSNGLIGLWAVPTDEWGYRQSLTSETERQAALVPWLERHNKKSRHSARGGKSPIIALLPTWQPGTPTRPTGHKTAAAAGAGHPDDFQRSSFANRPDFAPSAFPSSRLQAMPQPLRPLPQS